jgi:hypothetical protein
MMSAIIYYGAPTKAGQTVSEEVKARKINLLRSTPTEAFPLVTRDINTIQYLNYCNNFPAAVQAAITNVFLNVGWTTHYYSINFHKTTPPFMRIPNIVWSYDRGIATEGLSGIKERFNACETVAQGKPAFMATLSPAQVGALVKDTEPLLTTPASTTTINISSYQVYLRLHRLADLFFRIHQYPLSDDSTVGQNKYFSDSLQIKTTLIDNNLQEYVNLLFGF